MTLVLGVTLLALGVLGAFVAGLLGVGGAIVTIPLLLYVPPALGVGRLEMKAVAAITMVQVFVAALSGVVAHRRYRTVNADLAWVGGLAMATGSLIGALASKFFGDRALVAVFAAMVTAGALLMLFAAEPMFTVPPAAPLRFSRVRTVAVAAGVGLMAGLVGAGGAFLLVPLLLVVVGVPTRVTIGSSLAMTAMAATAGVAGKLITGQVPLAAALAVALGAVPGAQLGAAVSHRLPAPALKLALAIVILLTAARMWADLLFR